MRSENRSIDGARRRLRGRSCVPLLFLLAGVVFIPIGCDKSKKGPKWEDNQRAHAARFHPDVDRKPRGTAPAEEPGAGAGDAAEPQPATRPGLELAPVVSPVMFVNGDTIGVPDILEPIWEPLERQSRALTPEDYREYLLRETTRQIEYEISTVLLYQEAKNAFPEAAMKHFDKEADQRIKDIINARFGGVHARYEQYLKGMNTSVEAMRERAKRREMVIQYLRERIRPRQAQPSRRELMTYYEAHKEQFTTPAKAELFLIEIPLEAELGKQLSRAAAEEIAGARKAAREKLERAREELASGVSFAAVAKQYSKGLHADEGGALGEISPGALTRRWAKAAEVLFTLEPDAVSDIVETEESFFIVKCGRKTPEQTLSFEDAQARMIDLILEAQFEQLRDEYILKLRAKATIQKYAEFRQAVFQASPRPEEKKVAG